MKLKLYNKCISSQGQYNTQASQGMGRKAEKTPTENVKILFNDAEGSKNISLK